MSSSEESCHSPTTPQKKYKGVRRRKWGKWVSEIRVPRTQERLWLGSYACAEAAAVAHDIAYYCLREATSPKDFNLPLVLPAGVEKGMSPMSVQKAATDAGMAVDAQLLGKRPVDMAFDVNEHASSSGKETGGRGRWKNTNDDDLFNPSWDQMNSSSSKERQSLDISVEDYLSDKRS